MIEIYTDGGSRGNPGNSGSGVVIYKDNKVIFEGSYWLGVSTNNIAEYTGILIAHRVSIEREIATSRFLPCPEFCGIFL